MLTSSVEYGLQDLCKVRALFRLGAAVPECSQAGEHPKMVPACLVAGGASEESTVVHHVDLALLLNPGRSLQWDPP